MSGWIIDIKREQLVRPFREKVNEFPILQQRVNGQVNQLSNTVPGHTQGYISQSIIHNYRPVMLALSRFLPR